MDTAVQLHEQGFFIAKGLLSADVIAACTTAMTRRTATLLVDHHQHQGPLYHTHELHNMGNNSAGSGEPQRMGLALSQQASPIAHLAAPLLAHVLAVIRSSDVDTLPTACCRGIQHRRRRFQLRNTPQA